MNSSFLFYYNMDIATVDDVDHIKLLHLWYNEIKYKIERMNKVMETGINAWIANYTFDFSGGNARIDLPGGWYWDISPNQTGYLKTPNDELCVGYDLNNNIIQFGADGKMTVPGLNLWTVQEMGEKFARENVMDAETCIGYDQFAKDRGERRKQYEKGVRAQMTGLIQMELYQGVWTAHVDAEAVHDITGIESDSELTREQGIALFNRMSEARHVMPLRDPMGYMTLEGNVYDYIKEQYEFQYDDTIQNIDAGFINGNGRGCEAVLDKLDVTVRKNVREYCLPDGVNYQDLRFMETTPEIESAVNEFVRQRVTKTVNFEKKRSHSKESLERDHEKFVAAGEALKDQIADAALAPMDFSFEQENGIQQ